MLQFFVMGFEHSDANSIILGIKVEIFVCYFIFNQITKKLVQFKPLFDG